MNLASRGSLPIFPMSSSREDAINLLTDPGMRDMIDSYQSSFAELYHKCLIAKNNILAGTSAADRKESARVLMNLLVRPGPRLLFGCLFRLVESTERRYFRDEELFRSSHFRPF